MGLIKIPEESINYFKNNLDEIFASGNMAEGQWNTTISDFIKELTGVKYAIPTNSNGAGMVALISIYRHYYGRNTILIQSNTMYGVKTMVFAGGCKLTGFIDCRIESLMPSLKDVENAISTLNQSEKEKLIILLSHIGGIINPDIEQIANLCKDENIILLEDCAHSFGATLNDKHSGLFGDAGVYSFYATKAIPCGEGGVVVTKQTEIGEMVTKYSIYDRFEQKLEIGNNIRVSEVQALLSLAVIKEYNEIINNKTIMAKIYMEACKEKGIKYISQCEDGQSGNYYKFIIYSEKKPVKEAFSNLKTVTSPVYDYDIGVYNNVANYHACLPIWYNQEHQVVNQVIKEL